MFEELLSYTDTRAKSLRAEAKSLTEIAPANKKPIQERIEEAQTLGRISNVLRVLRNEQQGRNASSYLLQPPCPECGKQMHLATNDRCVFAREGL